MKGNDIILNDFLSRKRMDDSNSHEIIPISFDMQAILRDRYYNVRQEKYYNLGQEKESRYLIQTESQAKTSGIKLTEVNGIDKGVDPSVKPGKILKPTKLATKRNPQSKPRLGQVEYVLEGK